ncbi:hypothetical protein AB4Z38_17380 [Arthrobacter sp. 2RAF6]|uniref:hypothetical protein n=1 Tax=Arthrobacter sp. 2RAF6 TaxID=3233002 RepID=UPI003F914BC7
MKLVPPTPTAKAPQERFAGDVYLNSLHNGEAPSRLVAAIVRFTPGARTNWQRGRRRRGHQEQRHLPRRTLHHH